MSRINAPLLRVLYITFSWRFCDYRFSVFFCLSPPFFHWYHLLLALLIDPIYTVLYTAPTRCHVKKMKLIRFQPVFKTRLWLKWKKRSNWGHKVTAPERKGANGLSGGDSCRHPKKSSKEEKGHVSGKNEWPLIPTAHNVK